MTSRRPAPVMAQGTDRAEQPCYQREDVTARGGWNSPWLGGGAAKEAQKEVPHPSWSLPVEVGVAPPPSAGCPLCRPRPTRRPGRCWRTTRCCRRSCSSWKPPCQPKGSLAESGKHPITTMASCPPDRLPCMSRARVSRPGERRRLGPLSTHPRPVGRCGCCGPHGRITSRYTSRMTERRKSTTTHATTMIETPMRVLALCVSLHESTLRLPQ